MSAVHKCDFELVAEGPLCRVERCSHGTLHVVTGSLTLRMTPRQLMGLSATLGEAVRQLTVGEPAQRPPERLLC